MAKYSLRSALCWRCCSDFRIAPSFSSRFPRAPAPTTSNRLSASSASWGISPSRAWPTREREPCFSTGVTGWHRPPYGRRTTLTIRCARILSWAHHRGLIQDNPCAKGGKLYHGTRVDKVWSDDEVARFLDVAPPHLRLAMLLAINTGQRQGDLLKLTWSAYDGQDHPRAPAKDWRLCAGAGVRRVAQAARCCAAQEPDHPGEHRRQAVVGERLSGRVGQGNGAGRDYRSARSTTCAAPPL